MSDSESRRRTAPLGASRPASRTVGARRVPDVSYRLATLERQVEEALAVAGQGASLVPPIERLLDEALGVVDRLRRAVTGEADARAALADAPIDLLYRWWWRVDVVGAERIPRRGPVLVVANRAGTLLPFEAIMLARAFTQTAPEPRAAHPLVDEWLFGVPLLGAALAALGAGPATPASARRLLAAGEAVIGFPEGPGAIGKPLVQRYRLATFRGGPLLRAAVDAGAPIVPAAVIGAEDAQPVLWRAERLGRLLGLPAVPITPVLMPFPTKWTVHVGEPIDGPARAAGDRKAMRALGDRVRERLQGVMSDGLGRRRGLFV